MVRRKPHRGFVLEGNRRRRRRRRAVGAAWPRAEHDDGLSLLLMRRPIRERLLAGKQSWADGGRQVNILIAWRWLVAPLLQGSCCASIYGERSHRRRQQISLGPAAAAAHDSRRQVHRRRLRLADIDCGRLEVSSRVFVFARVAKLWLVEGG